MPLENRNVEPGTVLTARYKGKDRTCEVVQTDEGLRYRLDDGTEHRSPSSAGKAAMGGVACNGWRFWSVEGTEKRKREPRAKTDKPKKEPAAKKRVKTKAAPKKGAKAKGAKKGKSARMSSDASFGCGVCSETFPTMQQATAHAMTHTG
jgi:hypothetical protein